jgi:hypothetical protein
VSRAPDSTAVHHPAVVVSECYAEGSPIPGTARLAMPVLDQDEVWRTKDGRVLTLDEMEPGHRRNLLAWLERRPLSLLVVWLGEMTSGPLAARGDDAWQMCLWWDEQFAAGVADPSAWLRERPLHRRLAALVADDNDRAADAAPF